MIYDQCNNCGNWLKSNDDHEAGFCEDCIEVINDYWQIDVGDNDDEEGHPVFFDGRWINSKDIEERL